MVELARREDVAAMAEISNWAAVHTSANLALDPEPLAQWLAAYDATHERYPWLAARAAGRLEGFAKAGPHHVRGAYAWTADTTVYAHPDCRGRGVGTALYARLIELLEAQGFVTLCAGITGGNAASEALHARFGFRRFGTLHRAGWKFGQWHDKGLWELALRGEEAPGELRPVAAVMR
ncbi:MAG TPA: GNAT family N-acetyltransferase [Myxococcales bacterium]|nr:GNAT family N-acetyltransferase [Myxococcales bacterium]